MDSQAAFLPQGYGFALAAVALYWLLLALPGFVLLRRYLPEALEDGGLGSVSVSYLASFVVLSPVSILGYALHLSLWVMSGAFVFAVIASAIALGRDPPKLLSPRQVSIVALVAVALIAADMWFGLRTGSHFGGDGRYHAARIRTLFDHGFNNWDPFVSGRRFDDVYHTNVYHALIGASAQLAGVDPAAAWAFTWFFAKLVCAGSAYRLAWAVSGERWIGWVSSAVFAVWMAPSALLPYPNMLSPYWLVSLAIAFFVELQSSTRRRVAIAGIAASAWVMPQVHALYYVFVCLLLAPLLLLRSSLAARAGGSRREWVAALLVLALGAPWLGVTMWHRANPAPQAAMAPGHPRPMDAASAIPLKAAAGKRAAARTRDFIQFESGMLVLNPSHLQLRGTQFQLLVLLAFGLAAKRRRAQWMAATGVVAVVMAALYVPPLCTALAKLAGAPWIVRRLTTIPVVLYLALLPCLPSMASPERFARPWTRVVWLGLGLAYAVARGVDSKPWERSAYLRHGWSGRAEYGALHGHAMRRVLFQRNVPSQATIVAPFEHAGTLGVFCDCYPLALSLTDPNHGIKDMDQRRADVSVIFDPTVPAEQRIALLRYHRVRHLWVKANKNFQALRRAYRPWLIKVDAYNKDRVFTLDLKRRANPQPTPSPR
jgi:hypothetical protein